MGLKVLAICPYHLPQFINRARFCFAQQTYPHITWCEWNTSLVTLSVGAIRNQMIKQAPRCDLIAHADHDDWSHPDRIAQQVALMELTGAPIVGYYDMPFWDEISQRVVFYDSKMRNYAVGTSLLYRREVWEQTPFPDLMEEDTTWQRNLGQHRIVSISSLRDGKPMMFATIHAQNTSNSKHGPAFEAAHPELDAQIRTLLSSQAMAS